MAGSRLLDSTLRSYLRPYVTDAELAVLLDGTPDSRYGKVKRLLAQGLLLHIRRGLYCMTNKLGYSVKPHPFELAQYIYGPSYISLESELSFHKLIPERVYAVTSVTGKRSNKFKTLLGEFSYLHLPIESLYSDVELINEDGYQYFMAKPWKAICDYVFCYKKDWISLEPLLESLRIDLDNLPMLSNDDIQLLEDYYQSSRVSRFLKGVNRELYDNNQSTLLVSES